MGVNWGDEGGVATRPALTPEQRKATGEALKGQFDAGIGKALALLDKVLASAAAAYESPDDAPAAVAAAWEFTLSGHADLGRAAQKLRGKRWR